jgi:hypothetical protein
MRGKDLLLLQTVGCGAAFSIYIKSFCHGLAAVVFSDGQA